MQERPRVLFAPRDWEALKHAYETSAGALTAVAAANGIRVETLRRYAKERAWTRPGQPPTVAMAASTAVIAAGPPAPPAVPPPPTADPAPSTRLLSRRLRRAIGRQLDRLEQIMDEDSNLSAAEHERHIKVVGTLAKNLETVDGLDRTDGTRGRAGNGKPVAAPQSAGRSSSQPGGHDADELRRELAARIRKLRERLDR